MAGPDDVTLAILAGGRGKRLGGVAKGLIRVNGRELLSRQLDLAPQFADVVLIADDPSPYAAYALRTASDIEPGRGAPGGLHAALFAARTPWICLIACDMPFVSAEAIGLLLGRCSNGQQWICFEREGRLEPMPGVYHRELLGPLEARLPENPSFQQVLRGVPGTSVPLVELDSVDPEHRSLVSLNTPEDLMRHRGVLP